MEFIKFKQKVAAQFERMRIYQLYRTEATKEDLWAVYLNNFVKGSNPIYKERTEHDCQACKAFIRDIGGVIAIDSNGQIMSIWDIRIEDLPAYQAVANALASFVKSKPIQNVFLHHERAVGLDKNFSDTLEGIKTWNHFHVNLPMTVVKSMTDIPSLLGKHRESYEMLERALSTIKPEVVDIVLELIDQNSLYRGAEHKVALLGFKELLGIPRHSLSLWAHHDDPRGRIRNTVIGTLLVDLSEGRDLETAVKSYEDKVAPTNYKRPTALVTKGQVEAAKAKIEELGFSSALQRRNARLEDLSINNVLFADRSVKHLTKDVFDSLATTSAKPNLSTVEDVTIDQFLSNILPYANSLEVFLENRHQNNLVSLIAPDDPTARQMFKWPNNFSWSYNGNFTDSIKERVKAAGGNVTGEFCCRLAWDYTDDLDFHLKLPNNDEIYYGRYRRQNSPCGGQLDLDANGCDGQKEFPVENIFYNKISTMREGVYTLYIHNWNRRSNGVGFEAEIDILGTVHHFVYDKVIKDSERVVVAKLKYSKIDGLTILESLPTSANGPASKNYWGLSTQGYHKVSALMLSPNFWDGKAIGNKHFFFMLDQCRNEDKARGFFNEFLTPELEPHRKVMEMVGSKLMTDVDEHQLSGLGFSSTQKSSLLCRVSGSFNRTINIVF